MIKHKYKCCLSENIEEVESEEEDNNDKQIVKQFPALETDDNPTDSYTTTIPYNFKK